MQQSCLQQALCNEPCCRDTVTGMPLPQGLLIFTPPRGFAYTKGLSRMAHGCQGPVSTNSGAIPEVDLPQEQLIWVNQLRVGPPGVTPVHLDNTKPTITDPRYYESPWQPTTNKGAAYFTPLELEILPPMQWAWKYFQVAKWHSCDGKESELNLSAVSFWNLDFWLIILRVKSGGLVQNLKFVLI